MQPWAMKMFISYLKSSVFIDSMQFLQSLGFFPLSNSQCGLGKNLVNVHRSLLSKKAQGFFTSSKAALHFSDPKMATGFGSKLVYF